MKRFTSFTASLLLFASSAAASDFVFGIGQDDIDGQGTEAAALQLEYHTDPIREYRWGSLSGMVVTQVDADRDTYFGVGVSMLRNLSNRWFFEANLSGGYYDQGRTGTDLGGNLQFRTLIGFGYHVSENARISLALDHMSNAGIEKFNPGRETVTIRYSFKF